MTHRMRRWHEVTWKDIERDLDRLIGVLPLGSVEQHGPHLPLGTDTLIPTGLADRLVEHLDRDLAARMIMLPPVYYTYAKHSNWWPGTLNLDGCTLTQYVRDLCRDAFRQGLRQMVLFNGHMESVAFISEGLELAVEQYPNHRIFLVNWWDMVSDELIDILFGDSWPGWELEHAALTETSLMLALWPELVRAGDLPHDSPPVELPYTAIPQPACVRPPSGVYADCRGASSEIGEKLVEEIITGTVGALTSL